MRALPSGLSAALASGAAGLATAWILTRADGVRLGFTDHDEPLIVEGVTCAASTGWTLGAAHSELDGSAGLAAATGALDSAALTEADIARGLYDGAAVQTWRVLWSDPAERVLVWKGTIARLARDGQGFTAEIEGPLAALERVVGRTYGRLCDAELGDGRCRAEVSGAAFNGSGVIVAVSEGRRLTVSGLGAFADGWFSRGLITWSDGTRTRVGAHNVGTAGVVLVLAETAAEAVAGAAFTVRAGCDRSFAQCGARFANQINFQGFPDIPGDDFLAVVASSSTDNDGGSRR